MPMPGAFPYPCAVTVPPEIRMFPLLPLLVPLTAPIPGACIHVESLPVPAKASTVPPLILISHPFVLEDPPPIPADARPSPLVPLPPVALTKVLSPEILMLPPSPWYPVPIPAPVIVSETFPFAKTVPPEITIFPAPPSHPPPMPAAPQPPVAVSFPPVIPITPPVPKAPPPIPAP